MQIPQNSRPFLLFLGILGAFILRIGFILAGLSLIHTFRWILPLFGLVLIFTGIKLLFQSTKQQLFKETYLFRFLIKVLPITDQIEGQKLWLQGKGTLLLLALLLIELSDVTFALDSIPAVLAITQDPLIAITSNLFAIMGLRTLYFSLEKFLGTSQYLHYALAAVLIFIGCKLIFF